MRPFLFACFLSPLPSARDTFPPPFRPCGVPSPPEGRRGGGSAPPGGGKITTPSKGTPPRRRSEEAEAFPNSPSRAGGPGEGQASTQSPRAGWEHPRQRANLRNGGPRGWAAWRQRGCAESADCAHPLAILWFLSHRWERNPPRRAELWEKLILRLRNVLPPPAREGKRNRKGTSPSVRKMSLIPHRL